MLKELVERSKVKIDAVLTYCRYSMNDTTFMEYKDFFASKGKYYNLVVLNVNYKTFWL